MTHNPRGLVRERRPRVFGDNFAISCFQFPQIRQSIDLLLLYLPELGLAVCAASAAVPVAGHVIAVRKDIEAHNELFQNRDMVKGW